MSGVTAPPQESADVVLFDGTCNLCHGAVQFVLRRDPGARFRFASLQSVAGRRVLAEAGAPATLPDSLILVRAGRIHWKSAGALRIARRLRWPWPVCSVLLLVPAPLRDLLYDFVARNRHRWFGTRTTCMVPTPALRARFLDADERSAPPAGPGPAG
jgi:predicted DCC family thiol-disulfide oxidoreductase YuxK